MIEIMQIKKIGYYSVILFILLIIFPNAIHAWDPEDNRPPYLVRKRSLIITETDIIEFWSIPFSIVEDPDPIGEPSGYPVEGVPSGAYCDQDVFRWYTHVGDAGFYPITFEVTDPWGAGFYTTDWVIVEKDRAPVINEPQENHIFTRFAGQESLIIFRALEY